MVLLLQLLRALLDVGNGLPEPDGILINGLGPNQAIFEFEPGEILLTIPFYFLFFSKKKRVKFLHVICFCESF